eukprot:jgi/Botrbrau1/20589/Bobra.113_1s0015.1
MLVGGNTSSGLYHERLEEAACSLIHLGAVADLQTITLLEASNTATPKRSLQIGSGVSLQQLLVYMQAAVADDYGCIGQYLPIPCLGSRAHTSEAWLPWEAIWCWHVNALSPQTLCQLRWPSMLKLPLQTYKEKGQCLCQRFLQRQPGDPHYGGPVLGGGTLGDRSHNPPVPAQARNHSLQREGGEAVLELARAGTGGCTSTARTCQQQQQ